MGNPIKNWGLLFVLALIWGSSFILMKRGLYTPEGETLFTGLQVGALRIVFAALFTLPLWLRHLRLLRSKKVRYLLVVGICGNALPAFLFATAETEIPSALAGMLNATTPLFTMIIAYFIFRVDVNRYQVSGLFIGLLASIGLLYSSQGLPEKPVNIWYGGLVLIACICYAISLNTIKQFLQTEKAVAITSLALLLVSPAGIFILAGSDFYSRLSATPGAWQGLGAVAVLGIVGTALALILFNKLVQDTNTLFTSSVTYLIPLVAIGWGLFDGELINGAQIFFGLIMLGGVILLNLNSRRRIRRRAET